ncbi:MULTISPECIES: pirin family protein [unclassified Pseudomonas]|uniref:pirin family protein n=1 Tax=unclassified Pseudomonas TaxID=196821 RepID=UPI000DA8F954|nr:MULTISPECIES: pirin family protein [unclassified Pseudomonas]MDW3713925.1 pirin family protein [Pseudomonas sp. 2023EL-01195]PZE10813.1 pirin family protein [Pseudomonas sp. 57B-090624]
MNDILTLRPRAEEVAGLPILRPLPAAQCRSVGPFVFFDHMLASAYPPGQGMDVRQHPHIGLSTLTYLFEGELQHKDSLGSDQRVQPGDVSWMTAGAGVAHVERTPAELVARGSRIHGLQVWLALPREEEERAPSYSHHSAASLPQQDALGVRIRLVAGSGFCLESPVPVLSPTLYADVHMEAGATLLVPTEHPQRALYLLDGEVLLDDQPLAINTLTVLPEGVQFSLAACGSAHLVIIGGAPLDGPRRMNWNFVSSDPQRIDAARARWAAGDWPHVPGETTRIELPR